MSDYTTALFGLHGRVAMVTGATGVLGGVMALGLAQAGARVGVLGRDETQAAHTVRDIEIAGGQAMAVPADVLDRENLEQARDAVLERWGRIDILVTAAGGNIASATVQEGQTFFDLATNALEQVIHLNLMGTLLPCQVFGPALAAHGDGCIVTISSVSAQHALSRVVGYGAAKAGVESATRWLAMELAGNHAGAVRANCIAPGFFVAEQNRDLLLRPDGGLTPRGQAIINRTPVGRFGEPVDLVGTLIWLCSPSSRFVNGVVVTIDGGFSSWSGV